jgi:hypothetical protein
MTQSSNTCLSKRKLKLLSLHPIDPYARIFEAQMEGRANLLELISADAAKPDNISQRVLKIK